MRTPPPQGRPEELAGQEDLLSVLDEAVELVDSEELEELDFGSEDLLSDAFSSEWLLDERPCPEGERWSVA